MSTPKIFLFICLGLLASCQNKTISENTSRENENAPVQISGESGINEPAETKPDQIPTPSQIKMNEIGSRIGNVEAFFKEGLCLKIQNPDLRAGDKIQVVTLELPQKTAVAVVVEKTSCKRPEWGGDMDEPDIVEYTLKQAGGNSLDDAGYGIGLVNIINQPKVKNGRVVIDIDNDKKDEYFRNCYSMEGMHSTVWKGKPLVGKRIWHSYYHFGFDTIYGCNKKDFEGIDD